MPALFPELQGPNSVLKKVSARKIKCKREAQQKCERKRQISITICTQVPAYSWKLATTISFFRDRHFAKMGLNYTVFTLINKECGKMTGGSLVGRTESFFIDRATPKRKCHRTHEAIWVPHSPTPSSIVSLFCKLSCKEAEYLHFARRAKAARSEF